MTSELIERLEKAAKHKMTPEEVRAQRLSFIVGQTGFSREKVLEILPELASQVSQGSESDG